MISIKTNTFSDSGYDVCTSHYSSSARAHTHRCNYSLIFFNILFLESMIDCIPILHKSDFHIKHMYVYSTFLPFVLQPHRIPPPTITVVSIESTFFIPFLLRFAFKFTPHRTIPWLTCTMFQISLQTFVHEPITYLVVIF